MSQNSIPDQTGSTLLQTLVGQPAVVTIGDRAVCPDCQGAGEISFNESWPRDPQHDQSARCGTCRGDGSLTLEQVADRVAMDLHEQLKDLLLRAAHALVSEHPVMRQAWAGTGFPLTEQEVMAEWLNDLGQSARLSTCEYTRRLAADAVVEDALRDVAA